MDLFETSSQFVQILRALVPQMQSLLRAAHFALKHSESEDYLFYAIIDLLDDPKVELNTKSTVFQFIDVLIHESFFISQQTNSHYNYPYVHNLKLALPKIILKVLPGTNNANLYNIFNNLKNISESLNVSYSDYEKQYKDVETLLSTEELESVEMDIPYPEINLEEIEEGSDPAVQAWEILLRKRKQSHYERLRLLKHQKYRDDAVNEEEMFSIRPSRVGDPTKKVNELMLSKKQILARMEDDRETHKKSKETLWVVNRPGGSNTLTEEEFSNYYWQRIEKLPTKKMTEFLSSFDEMNRLASASYKDPI
ncbi:CIC11C00000000489 [Sungouiella intermedia]|uniref:CIC11C00000000489 n=1 Tax=Sungouiella intermedia TaxID=45354 RepID=A0A1L0BST3_9ASCO|nr:CIC11C00000000489 [[Candida] intermedia]